MATSNEIPAYHPFDNSFINDPTSFKFKFTCNDDVRMNNLHCSFDVAEAWVDTKPVKSNKEKKHKKYPTKPKNHKKIQKLKARREQLMY